MLMLRRSSVLLVALAAACATPSPSAPPSTRRPPNVVVIVADDLGFMDVQPNNADTLYETPNLQRLAARGVRLTDGYASCPVCSPTRYALLTGRHPARAGLTDWLVGTRQGRFLLAQTID